jgi:Fur family peroxide stress response transcriptional regulator
MENMIILLKGRNLKVTPQRIAIAETIWKYGHIDIDRLYSVIREKFPTISLATLYKNINSFLEKRFIQEVPIPNHKTKYELILKNHGHFICTECGEVRDIEIDENVLKMSIQDSVPNMDRVSLSVHGVCCGK